MALDYMAIVSRGVYPTPTPTGAQRMAYAVSSGLLSLLPAGAAGVVAGIFNKVFDNIFTDIFDRVF